MRNYNKALIIVAALLVGGSIGFVIYGFVVAGSIEDSFNFKYEPSSPDSVEDLTFNANIASILFKYNTSPTPTTLYANIDVEIEVTGLYMEGKTYLDFFHPSADWWDDATGTFTFLSLPDVWFNPSHWFKSYNISVTVTLRTDVVYDLTSVTNVGSTEMQVPDGVILNGTSFTSTTGSIKLNTLGNNEFLGGVRLKSTTGSVNSTTVKTNFTRGFQADVTTGSIFLNYTNCLMGDNLIGTVTTGDVFFKSYNMVYTKDIILNLKATTGDVNSTLLQYTTMGANVTGTWRSTTGDVKVFYRDNLYDTGVKFTGSIGTGSIIYTPHPSTMDISNNIYSSLNYVNATYRYDFPLIMTTGSIKANAQSA
ncbi:MAG: hypothetical protein ACTSQW_02170 [Promethearchaeota archaeon]